MGKPKVCVIIPTYGEAIFSAWAIKSVQNQTVRNIEICIICDGSPESAIKIFKDFQLKDNRIKIFYFHKSERTGEPYRDIIIQQTEADNIYYCSHDDLWLPNHIAEMEKTLLNCYFTHTLHPVINLPEDIKSTKNEIFLFYNIDLADDEIIQSMLNGINYFGLTFAAHTKESYLKLDERWVTTPIKNMPTDLYMWRKFISSLRENCKTTKKITALNFPKPPRNDWTDMKRYNELKYYYYKIKSPIYRYWLTNMLQFKSKDQLTNIDKFAVNLNNKINEIMLKRL